MKKFTAVLSFLLTFILCFSLSGCIWNSTLEAPKNVRVISNLIRWDSVENAQGYTVRIENSEESLEENTTELSFEIGKLIEKEGEVSIQVKARGDGANYKDSEWTSPITYNFTYQKSDEDVDNKGDEEDKKDDDFTYPPTDISHATDWGIGYGYDVINSPYFSASAVKSSSILDLEKISGYIRDTHESNSMAKGIYAEDISSYMTQFSENINIGYEISGGWKSFTAGLESSFNLSSIDKSSEDVKRIYYSYFDNHSIHSYAIKNYGSIDTLRSMLSGNFVAAINRNITETRDKSDKELAEYLIQTYGTHLITGIILGGRIEYSQVFNTTNRELYEKIQRVGKEKASMGLKGIFSENLSTETSATLEEVRKDSSTITQTVVYTLGGMSVGLWTEEKLNENYNDWAKSLNEEENLNAIGVTENGMIALWSLIPDEPKYQGLRKEMESLYESTGKSVYDGVIEKYSATLSEEIKRTGKRTIDLSNYFCYDKDTISDITPGAYKDIYHNNILTLNGSYLGIPVYHYEIVGGYGIQDMYGDTQHSAVKLSLAVNSEHDLAITLQNIKMVSADGKPAIYLDDKVKDLEVAVTLLIENEVELKAGTNSEAVIDLKDMSIEGDGNLSVMGRNGNAQMQQAESEQGGIGICANNFTIAMNGKLTVNGGNGGNAYNRKNVKGDANIGDRSNGNPGYAGGDGGVGIFATSIVVKSGDIVVKGGNGGQGGDGGECNYAWGSSVKGGKGGNGGNGANAIRVQNLNIQAGVLFAYGGNGGDTGKRGGADSNDYGDGVFDAGGASNGDLGIVGIGGRGLSADSIDGNSMLITEEKGKDGTVNYDLNWD